mgnify:CR=1 FL=1
MSQKIAVLGTGANGASIAADLTNAGLDVGIRKAAKSVRAEKLVPLGNALGLARLALDKEMILLRQQPTITMGRSEVDLPIGSFLQATAEAHLQAALNHLQDDYMGSHWLASFALLALEAQRSLVSRNRSM